MEAGDTLAERHTLIRAGQFGGGQEGEGPGSLDVTPGRLGGGTRKPEDRKLPGSGGDPV